MADDNHNKNFREERSEIENAHAALRETVLPALLNAYDEFGPAVVLALTFIMADTWLETRFTADEWRSLIDIHDPAQVMPA